MLNKQLYNEYASFMGQMSNESRVIESLNWKDLKAGRVISCLFTYKRRITFHLTLK